MREVWTAKNKKSFFCSWRFVDNNDDEGGLDRQEQKTSFLFLGICKLSQKRALLKKTEMLSVAWKCRDDKGLNGLLLSQNDLHLILRGFTHGGGPLGPFFLAVLVKNCHRNGHF